MSKNKDIKPPKIEPEYGAIHPINQTKEYICEILQSIGFKSLMVLKLNLKKFNFDMLNIKESHPARQMHDTFYVNNGNRVLRTTLHLCK